MSAMLQDRILPVVWFSMWDVMSIVLNTNNPVSGSPLQIPFAWLLIFEVYTVSNLEFWVGSRSSLLGS